MVGKLTRDDLITGSVLPTLWGLNRYLKRNGLLRSHLANDHPDYLPLEPFNGNEYTQWGNIHETNILNVSGEHLNCSVNSNITEVFRYKEDFFEVSLDGILTSNANQKIYETENIRFMGKLQGKEFIELDKGDVILTEAKSTQHSIEEEPPLERGVLQIQGGHLCYQAHGHKARYVMVSVLYRGSSLRLFIYKPDAEMQIEIIERIQDFYNRKKGPDYYPSIDTQDSAEAFPKSESDLPIVNFTKNHKQVALDLYECVKTIKSCEVLRESLQAELMDVMGMHEVGVLYNEDGLGEEIFTLERKTRNYKAQPQKIVPAKPARSERAKKPTIKSDWRY